MRKRPALYAWLTPLEIPVILACDQEITRLRREIAAEQKIRIKFLQRAKKRQQRRPL